MKFVISLGENCGENGVLKGRTRLMRLDEGIGGNGIRVKAQSSESDLSGSVAIHAIMLSKTIKICLCHNCQ